MRVFLLLVLALVAAPAANAATNQISFLYGHGSPRSTLDLGGGDENQGHRGTAWAVDALHRISPRFHLGFSTGRFRSRDNISTTFLSDSTTRLSCKVNSTLLVSRVDIAPLPRYTLYGIAGVGWSRNSLRVSAVPSTVWPDSGTTEERVLIEDTGDSVGYIGGVGVDLNLTDRLILGFEARYQGSDSKTYNLSGPGTALTGRTNVSAPVNFFVLALKGGIRY